jgi:hypothetical protein
MHIELGADYTGDRPIYQGVCVNQIMDGGGGFFRVGHPSYCRRPHRGRKCQLDLKMSA